MECVKSADILKPAKSAAKGLMAVISGDKGGSGYVRQTIAKLGLCSLVPRPHPACILLPVPVRDPGSDPHWGWFWVWYRD